MSLLVCCLLLNFCHDKTVKTVCNMLFGLADQLAKSEPNVMTANVYNSLI